MNKLSTFLNVFFKRQCCENPKLSKPENENDKFQYCENCGKAHLLPVQQDICLIQGHRDEINGQAERLVPGTSTIKGFLIVNRCKVCGRIETIEI